MPRGATDHYNGCMSLLLAADTSSIGAAAQDLA